MEKSSENAPAHGSPAGDDLISTLPEELLHQVLLRLDSARAAADTSLLSRRWRGLWTRLPRLTVALHDVPFDSLEAALGRAARPGVHLLDIRVPWQDSTIEDPSLSSLLRAADRLSPVELVFALPWNFRILGLYVDLPRFRRVPTMDLRGRYLCLTQPHGSDGGFPSLERLSLSGCNVNLTHLIPRCPRLRVLRANNIPYTNKIAIHSASLQELVVENMTHWWTCRVDIHAPVLKQLTISFDAARRERFGELAVAVLAPMVEKVSWRCSYAWEMYGLGIWGLLEVSLQPAETPRKNDDSVKNARSQPPIVVNVLSLHMRAQDSFTSPNTELSFAAEIDKNMVTNFSCLDLHLTTKGHVFGGFVLHLLGMHRMRTAIKNLKIVLLTSQEKDACPVNCLCDEPKDWRTQTISLVNLDNMEIEGVSGDDHEFDFLEVIFRSAPMLKRVTVRLSDGVTPPDSWCTKINNIFMAYPFVECGADLSSGSTKNSQSCAST